jgi:hypothetical protein
MSQSSTPLGNHSRKPGREKESENPPQGLGQVEGENSQRKELGNSSREEPRELQQCNKCGNTMEV